MSPILHKNPNLDLLYQTRRGINVYASNKYHFHNQIGRDMILKAIMDSNDLIESDFKTGQDSILEYDFDYPIGVSHCIETSKDDSKNIYYKVRGNRPYLSRMIRGVYPPECSFMTVVLRFVNNQYYLLLTAWIGKRSRPELGNIQFFDEQENPMDAILDSANFWLSHALIDDEPSVDDLLKDLKLITKKDYYRIPWNPQMISDVLNKRLDRKDISLPDNLEMSIPSIKQWLVDNINLNTNSEFDDTKKYLGN